ncbi:uncharacterized protein FOMMEDRAFT_150994 [Fomitiporia mediterranea MF3/22]|uniref:uncharacterized protein n=1 Tax=Fomitiporia mediterranea (strain MF3/22) TaxID=694068 RepID=UPI0004407F3F|nr:uncharacterized protein FOMMEDRAFT_150994 [Fomitiporia mediterranea MF3/22]EJD08256.1 hypothetical protein FOMMEDRAFT_150994 [Fomitiporia mediterranea MF3/22]
MTVSHESLYASDVCSSYPVLLESPALGSVTWLSSQQEGVQRLLSAAANRARQPRSPPTLPLFLLFLGIALFLNLTLGFLTLGSILSFDSCLPVKGALSSERGAFQWKARNPGQSIELTAT